MSDTNSNGSTIDGTAVEVPDDDTPPTTPPADRHLELVRPDRAEGVLMPLPAQQVVDGMKAYQRLLRELLEPSDWQTHDKYGNPLDRPFLKKSGWRKIARAFNLCFERVTAIVERDEHGNPERAEVWIRAIAPNGQFGDGDGYCDASEGRFKTGRGRAKLENDLRSTATTRAKNRAISDLVGMGEVSAEEIDPAGDHDAAERIKAAGAKASDELAKVSFAALTALTGNADTARSVAKRIVDQYGHLPAAAGQALCYAASEAGGASTEPAATATPAPEVSTEPAPEADAVEQPVPAPSGSGGEGELDDVEELTQLLGAAHSGGYQAETITALAGLLFENGDLEALTALQARQLREVVTRARMGGIADERLGRATTAAAAQDNRNDARKRLQAWIADPGQANAA